MSDTEAGSTKRGFRRFAMDALVGVLIIGVLASLFFAFYVKPQATYERERVYRSMTQVSRLIDDRRDLVAQATSVWGKYAADLKVQKEKAETDPEARKVLESKLEVSPLKHYPDLVFGCSSRSICVTGNSKTVSSPIDAITRKVNLPYPDAILLVMDVKGNVVGGADGENRWRQFNSLGTTIIAEGSAKNKSESDPQSSTPGVSQVQQALELARSYGRGEENQVYEGFPARLSRKIGGEDYAIFIASHHLPQSPEMRAYVNVPRPQAAGSEGAQNGTTNASSSAAEADQGTLLFAYLIPENTIDWTSAKMSKSTVVNFLLLLVMTFLAIPFIKLFNQSPLKPIRVIDLAAALVALMMIVVTATLFVTVVLVRSSVTKDIEQELSFISFRAVNQIERALTTSFESSRGDLSLDDQLFVTEDPIAVAGLMEVRRDGTCVAQGSSCIGSFYGKRPEAAGLNVSDRAYFKAWMAGLQAPSGNNYVQFVKSKGTEMLSWAMMGRDTAVGAQLISSFPIAMRSPVLPRNYAFAVVLNSDLPQDFTATGTSKLGDVQFHTDPNLSLIENMVEEARDSSTLVSALQLFRTPGVVDEDTRSGMIALDYHGQKYFAVVRGIADTPWSVVALYDRSELLDLASVSVVATFLIACIWCVLVFLIGYSAPRLLRHRLFMNLGDGEEVALRSRSLWFFPNAECRNAGDGIDYRFETSPVEISVQTAALLVQALALYLWPGFVSVLIACVVAALVLIANYRLIARKSSDEEPPADEPAKWRPAPIMLVWLAGAMLVLGATAYLIHPQSYLLFVIALATGGFLQSLRWLYFHRRERLYVEGEEGAGHNLQAVETMRQSYIARALALLTVIIGIPTICIFVFVNAVAMERYTQMSLVTVAREAADQERVLFGDAVASVSQASVSVPNGGVKASPDAPCRSGPGAAAPLGGGNVYDNWWRCFGLGSYSRKNPGWFVSESKEGTSFAIGKAGSRRVVQIPTSGIFSAGKYSGALSSQEIGQSRTVLEILMEALGLPEARVEAGSMLGVTQDDRYVLSASKQYQPLLAKASEQLEQPLAIAGGDRNYFPFHPAPGAFLLVALFIALFTFFFQWLMRGVAHCLTGLYLLPVTDQQRNASSLLEDRYRHRSMKQAWDMLQNDGQRARLLTLATGRRINFRDRVPVMKLAELGYIKLTPYVRIADEKFADFIRNDLPREEKIRIRHLYASEDDRWEHLRFPLIIAFSAGCVLIAYTSPSAVQLVTTSFFALAAFLPLMRDPLSQIFAKKA